MNTPRTFLHPPTTIPIDMGHFAKKRLLQDDGGGYRLALGLRVTGFHSGEPCHIGRFEVFRAAINGIVAFTVHGQDERQCGTSDPRIFDLIPTTPDGNSNEYIIDSSLVHDGLNTIEIWPYDSGYAQTEAARRGWQIEVTWVRMELVAPPTFIIHGWDPTISTATWVPGPPACEGLQGTWPWQCELASSLPADAMLVFGQNPWAWDGQGGKSAIIPFGWDGKQAVNRSAIRLGSSILENATALGWNGQPDIIAHSDGGLVAKALQVQAAASSRGTIEAGRIVTFATPHQGSRLADWYTCQVGKHLNNYYWLETSSWASNEPLLADPDTCTWKDYYATGDATAHVGAFVYPSSCEGAADSASCVEGPPPTVHCILQTCIVAPGPCPEGPCVATPNDRLLDFQMRVDGPVPGTPNPFLTWLDDAYLEANRQDREKLFAVAGVCGDQGGCDGMDAWWNLWAAHHLVAGAPSAILGSEQHDAAVPASSARSVGSGFPNAECRGSKYSHLTIMEQDTVGFLALQGLSGAWQDLSLNGLAGEGNCIVVPPA